MVDISNMDVYVYLRKSRESEEDPTDTLERHRKTLLEFASQRKLNVLHIFEEVISGESLQNRPAARKMLEHVSMNKVKGVLVMDFDRLTRGDLIDAGTILRVFRDSDTLIITPTQIFDCRDEGTEMMIAFKALLAREELKRITERSKFGKLRAAKEGKAVFGAPFGYTITKDSKLVPHPEESKIIQMIFQKAADGLGKVTIANQLNLKGVKSPKGRSWHATNIGRIIANEVYVGTIAYGKTERFKRNYKYIIKKIERDRWIRVENAHEAIVSKELFIKANKAIQKFSTEYRKRVKLRNPLQGLVKCGYCDRFMQLKPDSRNNYKGLRCINILCKEKQKGVLLYVLEERILAGLKDIVDQLTLENEELCRSFQDDQVRIYEAKLESLSKEKEKLERFRDEAFELLEKGVYTSTQFLERNNFLSNKIQMVNDEIEAIDKQIMQIENKRKSILQIQTIIETYKKLDDPEEKNALLKEVLNEVKYIRKKDWKELDHFELQFYLKIPI